MSFVMDLRTAIRSVVKSTAALLVVHLSLSVPVEVFYGIGNDVVLVPLRVLECGSHVHVVR
jgi:hypothetical protein